MHRHRGPTPNTARYTQDSEHGDLVLPYAGLPYWEQNNGLSEDDNRSGAGTGSPILSAISCHEPNSARLSISGPALLMTDLGQTEVYPKWKANIRRAIVWGPCAGTHATTTPTGRSVFVLITALPSQKSTILARAKFILARFSAYMLGVSLFIIVLAPSKTVVSFSFLTATMSSPSSTAPYTSHADGTLTIVTGRARSGRVTRRPVRMGEGKDYVTPEVVRRVRRQRRGGAGSTASNPTTPSPSPSRSTQLRHESHQPMDVSPEISGEVIRSLRLSAQNQTSRVASGIGLHHQVAQFQDTNRTPTPRTCAAPRSLNSPSVQSPSSVSVPVCQSLRLRPETSREPLFLPEDSDLEASDSDPSDDAFTPSSSSSSSTSSSCDLVSTDLSTEGSVQSMPPGSWYVWLLCHDGISEEVGVEKNVSSFVEKVSSNSFVLRLDIAMMHWLDPSNAAYITPQRIRTFLNRVPDIDIPSAVGTVSRAPGGAGLQLAGTPWRVSSADCSRPHTARFFEMVGDASPDSLLFTIFLTPSTLTPDKAPRRLPAPTAPLPPYPSMSQIPPFEEWNEVYVHVMVWKECSPPYKLLAVRPRTVENWVHLTCTYTERLYLRFKEYVEAGGNIPADGTLRLFNTLKVWVTTDPTLLIAQKSLSTMEYNALHPPWAQRELHKLVKKHLKHGPWT
ncbi:hypothetical protein EV421DRAFT_1740687 [Armillaria borealis]|uniref:Uncharacterized protein n=1 Tax=Armillaria borealis TaxID=47425 RepID=A0AA39J339_9AGAR|nr:hypothetical protein EV421DRAFT_1740687 [Armillaria borealis]